VPRAQAPRGLEVSCNPCRERVSFAPTSPAAWGLVSVFDASGRRVRALGAGVSTWDLKDEGGRRVPAGVYWLAASRLPGSAGEAPRPTRVVVLP